MKVAIIGLGAIGASYGAALNRRKACELQIILDDKRYDRYKEATFYINDEIEAFNFHKVSEGQPVDIIIVAVKYHDLYQAIKSMRPFVGDHTTILSLMDGIDSEEIIGRAFGMDKMVDGMSLGTDAFKDGYKITYDSLGQIYFGCRQTGKNDHVDKLVQLFSVCGIDYVNPENMYQKLWWKFMINVGINQASAVIGANYDRMRTVHEAIEIMRDAMFEVIELSNKVGVSLSGEDYHRWLQVLHGLNPQGKTYMLQDLEAGKKTEVDMLAGVVIQMGKKYNVPTPVNEMLYKMIKAKEACF